MNLAAARRDPPFKERKAVGVKEDAVPLGKPHRARLGAVVDYSKQDEELRPGAVALVHGVREKSGVLAQVLVEARQRVILEKRLVLGQHVSLLSVQDEHKPEDYGEERAVDIVGVVDERLAQQLPSRSVVCGLKTA